MISLGLIISCSVGPSYKPPCVETPPGWKNKNDEKCEEEQAKNGGVFSYIDFWWEVFGDEKLNELENLALKNNRNLYVAYESIQEYRALMNIAAADFYPQITLNPMYTNTGELFKNYLSSQTTGTTAASGAKVSGLSRLYRVHELFYFLPVNLSYEVDLWGKIRDRYNSANYDYLAQRKDYESLMLTLTSSLANTYFQLRVLDAQIDLLKKVLKTRERAFQINKDRYEGQIILYADVALAGEEVESALIQYNEAIRERGVLEDQIAVLIGYPASEFSLEPVPLEGLPPCIPEGLPSEMLLRRPDIAELELKTRSAHALVKEAYSLFFPSLTLTAAGGAESPVLKQFLRVLSRYWMGGAQSSQLIFDGFKTPSNLQLQMARMNEASGDYQQQVLVAFQDVEDSLINLDAYAKEYDHAVLTVGWAQKAFELYSDRYQLGVINYINVVDTERDLLNFQITLNNLQGYRFLSTVQLIKSLGGGWTYDSEKDELDDEDNEDEEIEMIKR